ncbi:MAG: LamG-like jellyroll fold domain-containing protein [Planctomycetota bacterium]|jgi:hypothetical protein
MNTNNHNESEKRFSRFLGAVDQGKTAPDKQFLTQLGKSSTAHFISSSAPERTEERTTRRVIVRGKLTKLAVAAVVLVGVFVAIKVFSGTAAWAQVVKAFNNAANVHIVKTYISDDGRTVKESEAFIKNQTCFKADARDWSLIDDGRKTLTLYKDHKIAHLRDSFTPYWDYTPLILKVFRDNQPDNGIIVTRLPEECTQTQDVYQIDFRDYWQGTAYADVASGLPLRITGREKEYAGQSRDFEITFGYEVIADDLFSIEIPDDYRELPRITSSEPEEERRQILFGKVLDERGYSVADAKSFASFAHKGRTDADGVFALLIPPSDGTNSLGSMDFPMYVWACKDNDPYRVAWTVIRHPDSDRETIKIASDGGGTQLIEESHQGVKLIIEDEDEDNFAQNLPGDPGEIVEEPESGPIVENIVLEMGPANVVTGRVTDANGLAVTNATVSIDQMEMRFGKSLLIISNLDYDWKSEAFAVTDSDGNYQLNNLPISWTTITLKVNVDGYATDRQEFQNNGQSDVTGCDLQLVEGDPEDTSDDDASNVRVRFGGIGISRPQEDVTGEHYEDVQAGGIPLKGGGDSTADVVPVELYQDLILYYSFYTDNGEIVSDISGSGNNAQVKGAQYTTDDVLGGVMSFDGEDDCITVPGINLKQFTFSAWLNTQETGGPLNNRRIFLLTDGKKCYALQGNSRSLSVYVADGVEVNEFNWSFAKNAWTHVTLTHDGQTFRIYKNGILTESGDIETDGVTGTLYIGGTDQHRGGFWHGSIDELAFFSRALTDEEIKQLFNMTGTAIDEEPQDETSVDVESEESLKGGVMYGGYRSADD